MNAAMAGQQWFLVHVGVRRPWTDAELVALRAGLAAGAVDGGLRLAVNRELNPVGNQDDERGYLQAVVAAPSPGQARGLVAELVGRVTRDYPVVRLLVLPTVLAVPPPVPGPGPRSAPPAAPGS